VLFGDDHAGESEHGLVVRGHADDICPAISQLAISSGFVDPIKNRTAQWARSRDSAAEAGTSAALWSTQVNSWALCGW
jgi:hypothetical protein